MARTWLLQVPRCIGIRCLKAIQGLARAYIYLVEVAHVRIFVPERRLLLGELPGKLGERTVQKVVGELLRGEPLWMLHKSLRVHQVHEVGVGGSDLRIACSDFGSLSGVLIH